MSIENKVPMSDFTEVTDIADTARIIGLQDNENVKISLQSLTAKILSRVDEDILTKQDINIEGGVTGFNPIGQVAEGDKRAVSGEEVFEKIKKINILEITNKVVNGDFSEGDSGWFIGTNITQVDISNGVMTYKGGGLLSSSTQNWINRQINATYTPDRMIYITCMAKSDNNATLYQGIGYLYMSHILTSDFKRYSSIRLNSERDLFPTWGGDTIGNIHIKELIAIDLTDTFGIGNEPTVEEMDEIIESIGYFSGKIDYNLDSLRDSKFALKKDLSTLEDKFNEFLNFTYKTKLLNGGFENNKSNWVSTGVAGTGGGSEISSSFYYKGSKSLKITNNNGARRETQSVNTLINHKYYVVGSYNIISYVDGVIRVMNSNADSSKLNEWQTASSIIEGTGNDFVFTLGSNGNLGTYEVFFDELAVVDLTEMFGEGNEPTVEKMNSLIKDLFKNKTLTTDQYVSQEGMLNYMNTISKPLSDMVYGMPHIVTIANDDGRSTDYPMFKMMQKHGMSGTSFIIGSRLDSQSYLTSEQVKEMATSGWEIACHTYEHKNLTQEVFPDGVLYQVYENKKFLENLTGKEVKTFAFPFGATSPELQNLLRAFYKGARVSAGSYNEFGDSFKSYRLGTFWTDYASSTVDQIKSRIDTFLNNPPRHLMLNGHDLASVPEEGRLTLQEMEEIVIYLKDLHMSGRLEVVTFSDAVDRLKSTPYYRNLD